MLGKPLVRFCEGSGYNSGHGRDIVAPLGNQAANRENKLRPKVWGVPDLLETHDSTQSTNFDSSSCPQYNHVYRRWAILARETIAGAVECNRHLSVMRSDLAGKSADAFSCARRINA
jgi:hypothetical protein